MDDITRAWVAGILEGEGSFVVRDGHNPTVQLSMTDEDVVRRVHGACGVGKFFGPYHTAHQDQWKFHVTTASDAVWLMREILPFMGERRANRINEVISLWESWHESGRKKFYKARRVVSESDRQEIRSLYNEERGTLTALAKRFNTSRATIKKIVREAS